MQQILPKIDFEQRKHFGMSDVCKFRKLSITLMSDTSPKAQYVHWHPTSLHISDFH